MRARDERGAASVLAVGVVGVLLALGSTLAVLGAVVVAHRAAQSAADLAALAGAAARTDRCDAATRVAQRNRASVTSCVAEGRDVRVTVTVPGPRWHGLGADLAATARAGPVG